MLPNKIIPLPNLDKEFHESWSAKRNLLNFPHPFRAIFLGQPGCGKSTALKNVILRQHPPFQRIVVCHCDSTYTREYDDLEIIMLSYIPSPEEWGADGVKTLCIIEDMELKGMSKQQKRALDRLVSYVSTHKGVSVCINAQDSFGVAPCVRRCGSLFVLWRSPDIDSMNAIARKVGMTSAKLQQLFDIHVKTPRDSIWIDLSDNSPAPLRLNGFQRL